MGVAIGLVAFAVMLAAAAIVVLAAIAAVVEILPARGNQDADERGADMPAGASVHPRHWRDGWQERKPRTGFSP